MILRNPVTGHEVRTDTASADFWHGAGYSAPVEDKPKRKAPAKKAAPKTSNDK